MTKVNADWLLGQSCRSGAPKLPEREVDDALPSLSGWQRDGDTLRKEYRFPDFHATIEFVNAGAWIAKRQDHHPDLDVHYNRCGVLFTTHDAGGLSERDAKMARAIDGLLG